MEMIALLFASGVGFGLSCWICGILLDRSNNYGDTRGTKGEYRAYADFRVNDDNLSRSTYPAFVSMYTKNIDNRKGPQGTELVRRLTPEEIKEYNQLNGAPQAIPGSERWGEPISESLKGVFKPLEDEDKTGY